MDNQKIRKKEFKNIIIKSSQVKELAVMISECFKTDHNAHKKEWQNKVLPELEKRIEEHNKNVAEKKVVSSFGTYLPIGENDKNAIIQKEKLHFFQTSMYFYTYKSEFRMIFESEEVVYDDVQKIRDSDWAKVKGFEFRLGNSSGSKKIEVSFKNEKWNRNFNYEISGSNHEWVSQQADSLNLFIGTLQKPHWFTKYKWILKFTVSLGILVTIFLLAQKFLIPQLQTEIQPLVWSVIWLITFVVSIIVVDDPMDNRIDKILPDSGIMDNYSPFGSELFKIMGWVLTAIVIPIVLGLILKS